MAALSGVRPTSFVQSLLEVTEAEKKLQEAKDRLTNPVDYLKARFKGPTMFRYIQTHPDNLMWSVMQDDTQQRTIDVKPTVVSDEAQPLEFVQEEVDPRTSRADHFR